MRIFLDTNVLLDLLLLREGQVNTADILKLGACRIITPLASVLTIANTAYIIRKHVGNSMVAKSIGTLLKRVAVLPMDTEQVQRALVRNPADYEDALQAECALAAKCDCIVTNNIRHFKEFQHEIRIFTPSEFLSLFKDSLS